MFGVFPEGVSVPQPPHALATAPVQEPQALLLQVCVPLLQLPQLRVVPFKQATQAPVLGRHSGVLFIQVV